MPLELTDLVAKLVPPPRTHRHRYCGVLAPNWPLRAVVVALAQGAAVQPAQAEPASTDAGEGALGAGKPLPTQAESAQLVPPKRPAHCLWAVLIGVDRPHQRGVLAAAPPLLWRADANHRVHHLQAAAVLPRLRCRAASGLPFASKQTQCAGLGCQNLEPCLSILVLMRLDFLSAAPPRPPPTNRPAARL